MESPGSLSPYGDASSAVDEVIPVPDVQATIGSEGDDPAQQAEAAPTGGDGEQGAVEDHQGDAKKDEGEAPYEYPTGVVGIEELSMLPSMNAYEQWAATPGIPGEPLENVALTLKFEAMGAQDLTVGLAHKRGGKGGMYQLIIGNKGNLQVDLEKIQGRHIETVASRAGLLCSSSKAHKYWVSVKNGRLDFGVGEECGQHTVLSYQDAESPPIEVRYVGFTCLRHRATFRDVKMEAEIGGPLRSEVETDLEFVRAEGCDEGFSGEDKASLDAALEQYKKECDSMKRRARKFGTAYSPPFLQDWVPWTLVKRLSWNRDLEGGIDRESKEEREKRKLRAERFGGSEASTDAALEALKTPLGASVDPKVAEMMTEEKRYARSQKFSIPDQMWSIQAEEQGMRPADIFCQDPDRADPEPMATTFPHKIHIFSLDKMVCKQIRDNDVKAYFHGFGPKYVEWLSDWSFNVVFQDPEEAKNAAAAKSFGLPEVLPREIADTLEEGAAEAAEMGAMGWRLGLPMCKVHRDRWGPEGQWVRLLLRCSEAQDILLARPDTPAKPEGPVLRRGMVPPAVRTAQRLAGGDGGEGRRGGGGGGKRRRRDGGESGAEVMGQALKSQRTSKKRREPPKEEKKEWEGKGNSLAVAAAACAAANAADNAAAVGTAAAAVAAAAADTAGSSNAAGAAGAAGTAQHEDNPTAESRTPLPPADS